MKRLFLLRHAKASRDDSGRSDYERSLAARGIWAAEAMAEHCAKRLRRLDLVLCSSAIRTRETLRLFEQRLPPSCKTRIDEGLYLAESRALQKKLRALDDAIETVMLVGHEPGLSELAVALCGKPLDGKAGKRLAKGFKTGSLATIDLEIDRWVGLQPGMGRLRAMIRPKDIR